MYHSSKSPQRGPAIKRLVQRAHRSSPAIQRRLRDRPFFFIARRRGPLTMPHPYCASQFATFAIRSPACGSSRLLYLSVVIKARMSYETSPNERRQTRQYEINRKRVQGPNLLLALALTISARGEKPRGKACHLHGRLNSSLRSRRTRSGL